MHLYFHGGLFLSGLAAALTIEDAIDSKKTCAAQVAAVCESDWQDLTDG